MLGQIEGTLPGAPDWREGIKPLGGGPRQALLLDLVLQVSGGHVHRQGFAMGIHECRIVGLGLE